MLDTSYTCKAACRMLHDLHTDPGKFKGREILFIHTGIQEIQNYFGCEVFKLTKEDNNFHLPSG